jgi:phospholipid/cholesterol/gamma-HCH transport system ATP-binding protein
MEARDIVNRFGAQTVHDGVNLSLNEKEILALVGGSGSGKSVLLRTLIGLRRPTRGRVMLEDKDIYEMPEKELKEVQKRWGVLFQDGALFSGLSVLDNVCLPLREHTKLPADEIESLGLLKITMAGLPEDAAAKFPSELSGGMTRRAALARALVLDPPILFLDEPTDGLDPIAAAEFDELILKLRDMLELSVLIVTHDLSTMVTVCDRIALLVDKKITTGTLEEMLEASDPKVHEFFGGPRMKLAAAAR